MASIIGYSHYRSGPDRLVHIASQATFDQPYAGWWQSRCDQSFRKGERLNKPSEGPPTCLQCIGAPVPVVWVIPEDSWMKL